MPLTADHWVSAENIFKAKLIRTRLILFIPNLVVNS